jgi:hypothetical protein
LLTFSDVYCAHWCCFLQVIRQFFKDPEWVAAYDSSIPTTPAEMEARSGNGTIWGGTEGQRLVRMVPGLLHPWNGAWELCIDWLQPHKSVSYSVGLLGIR